MTITRRGKAVARLVPAGPLPSMRAQSAVQRLRSLRAGIAARGGGTLSLKQLKALRDEGRR